MDVRKSFILRELHLEVVPPSEDKLNVGVDQTNGIRGISQASVKQDLSRLSSLPVMELLECRCNVCCASYRLKYLNCKMVSIVASC